MVRVLLITLLALTLACQRPADTARAQEVPSAPQGVVTVSGMLNAQSAPFELSGGNYSIAWQVTARSQQDWCWGRIAVRSPDRPDYSAMLVSGIDSRSTPSGTTWAYNVPPGRYYLMSELTCPAWSVTFTPA